MECAVRANPKRSLDFGGDCGEILGERKGQGKSCLSFSLLPEVGFARLRPEKPDSLELVTRK